MVAQRKNKKKRPAKAPGKPHEPAREDGGFGKSHGYGPGHGGPSGPGDVPGEEAPGGPATRVPVPAEEDNET